jgi:tetratricopeptide (TPR) repeat protein
MPALHGRLIFVCLAATIFLSACSSHKELDRALQLEKAGQFSAALDVYKAQITKISPNDRQHLSELNYRVGECLFALDRPTEAFSAYNKAVELNEANTMAQLRVGELFLMAGSGDRAADHARAALRSGANLDALALLGSAAAMNGNVEIALDAFTRVLVADPGRVKVSIALAELYSRIGKVDDARRVLRDSALAQPRSAAPLLALGRMEEQEGNIKAAEQAYRAAVSTEDSPDSNMRLAQYLQRSARVSEAEDVLRKVDKMRPQFPTALSDFQVITGRAPKAGETYLSALQNHSAPAAKDTSLNANEHRSQRGQMVARLVEADLDVSHSQQRSAAVAGSAPKLARQHLEQFRRELDQATARMLEAEIALAENDLGQASVSANAAVSLGQDSAAAHYILGIVKFRSSDPSGARAEWESAIEQQSSFIPARLALANMLLKAGDAAAAQQFIVPAVRDEPANFEALILFARALSAQHSYRAGEVIAMRAEAVGPESAEPHMIRGQIALAQQRPAEALIQFQQAVLLEPRSRDAIVGLTNVYRSGAVTRPMLQKMEAIAAADKPSATLMEITGRLFADHHWREDAKRCLRRSLEIDPSRSSAAAALAEIQASSGEYSAARESASRINDVSQLLTGIRAEERQDIATAVSNYEAAVRAGDKTGVAANNLAWIYAQQGSNLDRALELANRARDLVPNSAGVLDTIGFVRLKRREYSQAVATLERAREMVLLQDDPSTLAEIKRHLAEAYLRAGQPDQAALVAQLRSPR